MEVTRISIVNLYSSSRYYYSFRFSSLLVHYTYGEERVRARAETRSTRVIRDGHDCGGETKKRKTKRERRKEEIERKKYCDETAKVVIANYEERIRLLIYAWLLGIGNAASLSGREIAGRCIGSWDGRGNGALCKISRSIERREVSKLDSVISSILTIIHGVSSTRMLPVVGNNDGYIPLD